ncbi:MAG: NFYB/HAP3 family transcription factor subunit [Candidatus Nanoarchaeia archaeon]|nr:NFYB/HAP3 family transcription factor subunit [Candidatus Haiyanarchaeum thermophilum]MCW1303174.1 NFYB/HAP3 family transcription factor subunit [Candidatus Haiyanarchaeum thermophilum]MCW1303840.1 NFYB/HAP3 family transcription factor subunit [Candidatus Haiyanarchaeum thermophilum]MCW1306544.1 NFYB/HAP3 family transcription factor subunit [Candidatus Haiyanarchaeum thermophilum]MCW1306958.1 NFYB/HAP3 family transcription factor subunit [Candidatus Haiyanarchaeum thermophilum]
MARLSRNWMRKVIFRAYRAAGITRFSNEAIDLLCEEVEKIARKILKEASMVAAHAKRKIVRKEDLMLVKVR